MFLDHPIAGVGPGRYQDLYRDYGRRLGSDPRSERAAHSLPIEIAAEQGLAGLVGWAGAALVLAGFAARTRIWSSLIGRAVTVSIFAFLVGSLFLHGSRLRLLFLLVGILLVIGTASSTRRSAGAAA